MISRPDQAQPKVVQRNQVFVAALAFLAVSLACSFITPFLPVSSSKAPLGLIAYVGKDGNVYTTDRDGKRRTAITQDASLSSSAGQVGRIYQYPTWAPDGQHLAFVRFLLLIPSPLLLLLTFLSYKEPIHMYQEKYCSLSTSQ